MKPYIEQLQARQPDPLMRITHIETLFPQMADMEKWFDGKYCPLEHVSIFWHPSSEANLNQKRAEDISEVVSPLKVRKAEWLRREGNEAWYGQRLALVQAVWDKLRADHEAVLAEERKKSEALLAKLNDSQQHRQKLEAEYGAAVENNCRLRKSLGVIVQDIKQGKIKSLKTLSTALRQFAI